ncbi:hypothetical protein ABIG04_006740 [Bradyrhizobium japonicum]
MGGIDMAACKRLAPHREKMRQRIEPHHRRAVIDHLGGPDHGRGEEGEHQRGFDDRFEVAIARCRRAEDEAQGEGAGYEQQQAGQRRQRVREVVGREDQPQHQRHAGVMQREQRLAERALQQEDHRRQRPVADQARGILKRRGRIEHDAVEEGPGRHRQRQHRQARQHVGVRHLADHRAQYCDHDRHLKRHPERAEQRTNIAVAHVRPGQCGRDPDGVQPAGRLRRLGGGDGFLGRRGDGVAVDGLHAFPEGRGGIAGEGARPG